MYFVVLVSLCLGKKNMARLEWSKWRKKRRKTHVPRWVVFVWWNSGIPVKLTQGYCHWRDGNHQELVYMRATRATGGLDLRWILFLCVGLNSFPSFLWHPFIPTRWPLSQTTHGSLTSLCFFSPDTLLKVWCSRLKIPSKIPALLVFCQLQVNLINIPLYYHEVLGWFYKW